MTVVVQVTVVPLILCKEPFAAFVKLAEENFLASLPLMFYGFYAVGIFNFIKCIIICVVSQAAH